MLAFILTNDLKKSALFLKSLHLRKKQFQIFLDLFLSLIIYHYKIIIHQKFNYVIGKIIFLVKGSLITSLYNKIQIIKLESDS